MASWPSCFRSSSGDVETLDNIQARAVGVLAGRAAVTDIVDVTVVEGALRRHDLVITSDADDLAAIAAAAAVTERVN